MKIEWMGHSCFAVELADGTRIVTDPFDESVGYPQPWGRADAVTVSHEHHDHNAVEPLHPARVLKGTEAAQVGTARIFGVPSFHDDAGGRQRGANVMFVIEADGLRVAHLGDLGHALSERQLAALGKVDVLMIPVGGFFTIDGARAAQVARAVAPRVVLPMHYKTSWMNFPISDEQPFLQAYGAPFERLDCLTDIAAAQPVVLLNLREEKSC